MLKNKVCKEMKRSHCISNQSTWYWKIMKIFIENKMLMLRLSKGINKKGIKLNAISKNQSYFKFF